MSSPPVKIFKKYRDPEIQGLQNSEVPFHPDHCGDRRKCLQSEWRVVGSLPQKKHDENANLIVGPEILLLVLSQFSKNDEKMAINMQTKIESVRRFLRVSQMTDNDHHIFVSLWQLQTYSNQGTSFNWQGRVCHCSHSLAAAGVRRRPYKHWQRSTPLADFWHPKLQHSEVMGWYG